MIQDLETKIKDVLETQVSPFLAQDGGGVEFISVKDGIVQVKMQGACNGCPGAMMTLKMVIEARLKEEVPEVKEVVSV